MSKGKKSQAYHASKQQEYDLQASEWEHIHSQWPQLVSAERKRKVLEVFCEQTCSESLSTFVCFACAGEYNHSQCQTLSLKDVDLTGLKQPDLHTHNGRIVDPAWMAGGFDSEMCLTHNACAESYSELLDNFLYRDKGFCSDLDERKVYSAKFCKECGSAVCKGKTPPLVLANYNYMGVIPSAHQGLTIAEEMMIAKCRAKCFILHLHEENESIPNAQHGLKGNIIVFPQCTSPILDMLPPPMEDVVTPICVLFVGSSPPTPNWLRQHAHLLIVRREKIRDMLLWLQEHNYLYCDVIIDQERIGSLDDKHVLPVHIETMSELSDKGQDILTLRYDSLSEVPTTSEENDIIVKPDLHNTTTADLPSIFEHVVVTDVDANSPSHQLRAAALCHVKDQAGGYIQVSHSSQPVNEFINPELFPLMYPTLFPYGVGGFENPCCSSKLALKRQVKHFLNLADHQFQEHNSFLFIVFNMLQ